MTLSSLVRRSFVALLLLVVPAMACAGTTNANPTWNKKMQELYRTLANLLTDISSDARFNERGNRVRIENEAQKLADLAHDLTKKEMPVPDDDPTVKILSQIIDNEAKLASIELKQGNREYARAMLRSIPSYCIACHTRNNSGPQFAKLEIEPSGSSLTSFERGEFFVATRQFDRAQAEFKKLSLTSDVKLANWREATSHSLAIAVRVKNDPIQALEVVQKVIEAQNAPQFIKKDAERWKTSILEWQKEPNRQAKTEEGLYDEAIRLMAKARELQKFPMDRSADILYLRASAVVHDLLQTYPKGSRSSEALFLAGISYEVLSPLGFQNLHNIYYEMCIRQAPHTPIAENCYRRYEENTIFGYSGSRGTDIPFELQKKLNALRSLSDPEALPTKNRK